MVNALRDGDGEALYAATSMEERNCSDLNAQNLRRAWEILIYPRIKSSRFVRSEPGKQTSNEVQATASVWYMDKKDNPWRLVMIANQAEGGAKATVLIHMLLTASLFDEQEVLQGTITVEQELKGVRRYRHQLEALGVRRIMLNPATCLTWDQFEQLLVTKQSRNEQLEPSGQSGSVKSPTGSVLPK